MLAPAPSLPLRAQAHHLPRSAPPFAPSPGSISAAKYPIHIPQCKHLPSKLLLGGRSSTSNGRSIRARFSIASTFSDSDNIGVRSTLRLLSRAIKSDKKHCTPTSTDHAGNHGHNGPTSPSCEDELGAVKLFWIVPHRWRSTPGASPARAPAGEGGVDVLHISLRLTFEFALCSFRRLEVGRRSGRSGPCSPVIY